MHRCQSLTRHLRPLLERLEDRSNPSTAYLATDLIADQPGVALITDPTFVNAWGISLSPTTGAFWISANGSGLSEVYIGDVNGSPLIEPFEVTTPGGLPTGQVFNAVTTDFLITAGGVTANAIFLFVSETGAITGWNPAVPPSNPPPSRTAVVGFQATDGAVYTGLALANNGTANFLYAADFHNGKIDVINAQFQQVPLGTGGFGTFTDPNVPDGFAPFNIAAVGGRLFVSYAKQDAQGDDAIAGRGRGFVSVFDTNGNFLERFTTGGVLNAPWGIVQAPAGFGDFGGAVLIGNSGNGKIHAFDAANGDLLGVLGKARGKPLVIDGLMGLAFGNGVSAGVANSLYFAAGPDNEAHGVFGKITANAEGTNPVSATLTNGELAIVGSRDNDQVTVRLHRGEIVVRAGGERIGEFDATAVGSIRFNGFNGDDSFNVDERIDAVVFADGGAGNDVLNGGSSNAVLLGNTGNDFLFGGSSRDILVGGDGRDFLFGNGADDILIGGRTTHDTSPEALTQLLAAWNSADAYATRVAAIRAGTGGAPKLDSTTVIDDGVRDVLLGAGGLDWFLSLSPDLILGRSGGEQVN